MMGGGKWRILPFPPQVHAQLRVLLLHALVRLGHRPVQETVGRCRLEWHRAAERARGAG